MVNFAIFASHNGSGFDAIYNAIKDNILQIDIKLHISNNHNSNSAKKAQLRDIPNYIINQNNTNNPDITIYNLLKLHNITHIFLSGYMKKLSPLITDNFIVINSHPSLLPKYGGVGMYGEHVHKAVIQNCEKISGVTLHYVNSNYDEGKIIYQQSINLLPNETLNSLETKIKQLESKAIVLGIKRCLS